MESFCASRATACPLARPLQANPDSLIALALASHQQFNDTIFPFPVWAVDVIRSEIKNINTSLSHLQKLKLSRPVIRQPFSGAIERSLTLVVLVLRIGLVQEEFAPPWHDHSMQQDEEQSPSFLFALPNCTCSN